METFWSKVMPACIANYAWAGEFSADLPEEKWMSGLKAKIIAMDDEEFDLFLACVVMGAAKLQMMGVTLTEKINYFRSLRA